MLYISIPAHNAIVRDNLVAMVIPVARVNELFMFESRFHVCDRWKYGWIMHQHFQCAASEYTQLRGMRGKGHLFDVYLSQISPAPKWPRCLASFSENSQVEQEPCLCYVCYYVLWRCKLLPLSWSRNNKCTTLINAVCWKCLVAWSPVSALKDVEIAPGCYICLPNWVIHEACYPERFKYQEFFTIHVWENG